MKLDQNKISSGHLGKIRDAKGLTKNSASGVATIFRVRVDEYPSNHPTLPPLLELALTPLLFLLCGTATQTIISVPLLIPPPLLTISDGASVVSSIGMRGPPLGINERWW